MSDLSGGAGFEQGLAYNAQAGDNHHVFPAEAAQGGVHVDDAAQVQGQGHKQGGTGNGNDLGDKQDQGHNQHQDHKQGRIHNV